ncbi:tRNA(Met) cytidine acetate ligase [Peptostreptococcus russellii]|uniref:tRNA(Met) cytidine acetate ligase n=1 Tax=Peptostreptococcus russellii TaxID=215200 RepID=UPI003F58BE60
MKIGGIIAEYNPFHNGHKYQIDKYKEDEGISHIVVAMSGNFVQRGGPAIVDKFSRAEMAIRNGADLVIEIPAYFSTQTAELYARGAILSLDSLKCLDSICFGSEEGSIERLKEVAKVLSGVKGNYEKDLSIFLAEKLAFPIAREKAIKKNLALDITDKNDFLKLSNNILGIEYLKELIRLDSSMEAVTIKRVAVDHRSTVAKGDFSSASSIRSSIIYYKDYLELINKKKSLTKYLSIDEDINDNYNHIITDMIDSVEKYLPVFSCNKIIDNIKKDLIPVGGADFYGEICYSILREENCLDKYFEVQNGLEYSIRKQVILSSGFEELISNLTSKNYSSSKIRRSIFNILLGIKKEDMDEIKEIKSIPYIRVLAFNKKGTEILKEIKNKSNSILINSPAKTRKIKEYSENPILKKMFDFDILSSNIYYQNYYKNNRELLSKGEPDFIAQCSFL